jgi:hypothetical protein
MEHYVRVLLKRTSARFWDRLASYFPAFHLCRMQLSVLCRVRDSAHRAASIATAEPESFGSVHNLLTEHGGILRFHLHLRHSYEEGAAYLTGVIKHAPIVHNPVGRPFNQPQDQPN